MGDACRSSEEGFCTRRASHRALAIRTRLLGACKYFRQIIEYMFYSCESVRILSEHRFDGVSPKLSHRLPGASDGPAFRAIRSRSRHPVRLLHKLAWIVRPNGVMIAQHTDHGAP